MKLRILASAAALAAAMALPGNASAAPPPFHTLDVALPDGNVAHLRYAGDVPPSVTVAPAAFAPVMAADREALPPFALFDRVAALMAAQEAALLREAEAMDAVFDGAPAAAGTGLVQVASMPGVCFEATRVVMRPGAAPEVTALRSAGCGATPSQGAAPTALRPYAPPQAAPPSNRLIEARLDSAEAPALVR